MSTSSGKMNSSNENCVTRIPDDNSRSRRGRLTPPSPYGTKCSTLHHNQISAVSWAKFLFVIVVCANLITPINSELEHYQTLPHNTEKCRGVIDLVLSRGWGRTTAVASSPEDGRNLRVCEPSELSCCTRELEATLQSNSVSKFQQDMQVASSYHKFMILINKARFEGEFLEIIDSAENRTHMLFQRIYPFIASQMKGSIIDLHAEMKLYYQGAVLSIDHTVQDFYSYLFPYVFQYVVDGSMHSMYDNYRNCLMRENLQNVIKPFGDLPERSAKQMAWTLEASRLTIKSLRLALSVISSTDTLHLTGSCSRALLKMNYCSVCEGHVSSVPCYGYCLNVMRGCLASVYELDTKWTEMVSALTAMIGNMYGRYTMENSILKLPEQISEAVQYAAINAASIKEQVYGMCGRPHRTKRVPYITVISQGTMPMVEHSDIQERLLVFMERLALSQGFYAGLPEMVCESLNLPEVADVCWNGQQLSRYEFSVVGSGLGQQLHNPEVNVALQRDMFVTELMNELSSLTNSLTEATKLPNLNQPRHESWFADDDNDDDFDGSGSGSGDDNSFNSKDDHYDNTNKNEVDSDTDIVFADTDTEIPNDVEITVRSQQNKPGSSSENVINNHQLFSSSTSVVIAVAVIVLQQFINNHHFNV